LTPGFIPCKIDHKCAQLWQTFSLNGIMLVIGNRLINQYGE
jgi:hypothetical protein